VGAWLCFRGGGWGVGMGVVRICGKNKYFNSGKFVFEKLLNLGKRKKLWKRSLVGLGIIGLQRNVGVSLLRRGGGTGMILSV